MPNFNVPFSGLYNTRIAVSNALSSSSGVIGAGVVGIFIIGANVQASDKDERYVNCFLTKMGAKEYIVKRPGFGALNTPSAGNVGSAILVWTGNGAGTAVITAFGATNSTIYSGTGSLGAITGKANGITETFVTTTPTLVVSSGDSTAWYYTVAAGVMTQITDADFPGNAGFTTVGTFAHMDGFACIMTSDGKLWASDLNSVTAWTANNFDSANDYPDKGIGAIRQGSYIAAFGATSIQWYANAGLTPFPLRCAKNLTRKVGAVSADAIATLADSIFFAGATDKGGLSIFQSDSPGNINRISTPEQDVQLALAGPTNISLTTLRVYGRSFVMVKANTTTFIYVIEDKRWHEWVSTTPLWYKCAGLSTGSQIITYSISNIATTGKVYTINPASLVFTDDSVAYTATFQSGSDDQGSPYLKTWDELSVVADQEPTTSTLTISASDDDYQTWAVLGTVDLADSHRRLNGLGASEKRAWKGTHSAATAMRIERLQGRVTVSGS